MNKVRKMVKVFMDFFNVNVVIKNTLLLVWGKLFSANYIEILGSLLF
jgi:hypothetical protein